MTEHILLTEIISVEVKCSFFGRKELVHLAVNYTNQGNFIISFDTPYYDPTVSCYKNPKLEQLCAAEIEVAKKKIIKHLEDEELAHRMKEKMDRKRSDRLYIQPIEHHPLHLFKELPKPLPREVKWRD
jgi:hypothetical protein